ncbi:MAG: DUF4332 domain-containing protein [Chloroflexi bacterium HGW-Chloroflexi-10]|nr:MAG: DUF4332 domain-containing protein [Chloroflexi bacterium HGW-Chloroflexi-10]
MDDHYYIDLASISLSTYEEELQNTELLPSRKIIKDDIENRFRILRECGINNLNDILTLLKTPDKVKAFAHKSGLSIEYLSILRREIASSQPKPVALSEFPGIKKETVEKLEQLAIKNTKQLFYCIRTVAERKDLCKKTGISYDEILELTKLTDVSRIKWVGANFARLLVDSPFDTVEKVANADYTIVYGALAKINKEKNYFKGMFGLNDMKLCVMAAKNVPAAISY